MYATSDVHVDGLRGRLRLIGLAAVLGLPIGLLLIAAIGLLWLLGIVTALPGRGSCRSKIVNGYVRYGASGEEVRTLRRVVLLAAAVVVVLVRHDGERGGRRGERKGCAGEWVLLYKGIARDRLRRAAAGTPATLRSRQCSDLLPLTNLPPSLTAVSQPPQSLQKDGCTQACG